MIIMNLEYKGKGTDEIKMNYSDLLENVLQIPQIKTKYDKELERDILIAKDSGMHTVFSVVFVPVLKEAINMKNEPLINQLLSFLDEMETSGDSDVAEVCEFTVLEEVLDDFEDKELVPYFRNYKELFEAYKAIRRYII